MIVFTNVIKMLSDNGWTSYRIRNEHIIPEGTMSRIRNGKPITTTTIDTICKLCNCQPEDIIRYIPDSERRD